MFRRFFGLGAVAACALALVGCDQGQQAAVNSALTDICGDVALGTQIAVDVSAGGSSVGRVAGIVGDESGKFCPTIIAQVQNLVEKSTAAGQTATLNVTTSAPSASPGAASVKRHAMLKLRRRLNNSGEIGPHYVVVLAPKTFFGIPIPTGL